MPTARYINPRYCLSFGKDDVVFLDLIVDIKKVSESEYSPEITQIKINEELMEFGVHLVSMLTTEKLAELVEGLKRAVLIEIQSELFSLYHASDLQPETPPAN